MSAAPAASGAPGSRAVVLGGRSGLVGTILCTILAEAGFAVTAVGRADFDPLDPGASRAFLADCRPTHVFNTVGYTQVDRAEDEPEQARRLNRDLPALWARLARETDFRLVHYSTDFVFDGKAQAPYRPGDRTGPASVYGATKLAGEQAVRETAPDRSLILRTAWLFGPGKANFVHKILTLARERDCLGVVHDQVGSPTYTKDLARYTVELVRRGVTGTHHVVNSGRASWCELAAEAVHIAGLNCRINPIPSSTYPQKAARPAYSVLDTGSFTEATDIVPRPWTQALRNYVYRDLGQGISE